MRRGIDVSAATCLGTASQPDARERVAAHELEGSVLADVRDEEAVGEILNASREIMSMHPRAPSHGGRFRA